MTPLSAPASIRCSIAGPPTPLAWKITGSQPGGTSASRTRMTPGVVWPSIVMPTQRSPSAPTGAAGVARHAGDRRGGVVEDRARDLVEAEDVDHRVHDAYVALADERAERPPPRGAGRDDQLRHADRQRVHGGRAEQRPLRPAEAQHAMHAPLAVKPQHVAAHPLEHQRHRGAARPRRAHRPPSSWPPARATSSRVTSAGAARRRRGSPSRPRPGARRARAAGRGRRRSRAPSCRGCR